jgi:pimeloyl-ACP methyl ester carboxylesterase
MHFSWQTYLLLLGVLVFFEGLAQSPARAQRRAGSVETETYVIDAKDGSQIKALMGTLLVPENRSIEGGNLIELAFIRVKAPTYGTPTPLFLIAGGPGGSSIESVKNIVTYGGQQILQALGRDIVGVDQRGVGLSKPNLQNEVRFGFPLGVPGNPREMMEIVREKSRQVVEYWENRGVDLSGYNTAESADDLDDVRDALGYRNMMLWGGGYGSHLVFTTLRRHGDVIDRAIVQSPEGPNHTIKTPSQVQRGLERVAALVAADPKLSQDVGNLTSLIRDVLARLDKEPVIVEVNHPVEPRRVMVGISKFDVQHWTANAIGRGKTMVSVPAAYHAMSRNDFGFIAQELIRYRTGVGIKTAMAVMMECASGLSADREAQIREEAKETLLGDAVNFPYMGICEVFGSPDVGEASRGPLSSDVDVLFICGDLDSRGPIENAEELMKNIPNSQLLLVANAAHDLAVTSVPGMLEAILAFMFDTPIENTHFELKPPRFEPVGR